MQLSGERIHYLLEVYSQGIATIAEEKELYTWVSQSGSEEELRKHIDKLLHQHQEDEFASLDWENIYQKIWHQIPPDSGKKLTVKRYRIASAAAILLLIGSGIYLLSRQPARKAVKVEKVAIDNQLDVKPGGTKAILMAGKVNVNLGQTDTSFSLAGNRVLVKNGHLSIDDIKPVEYTLITPRGGEYNLTLSDGTKVWLNSESKLVYPSAFSGDTRQVNLIGEAYFEVKQDADHPFIVQTSNQQVKVLGTEFNVNAYPEDKNTITTLVNGKIRVAGNNEEGKLILTEGQQSLLKDDGQLSLNTGANIDEAIAWKNGYFRFDKADIKTIMNQLSRWYNVQVSYVSEPTDHYFGALISRDNNISQVLQLLEATGEIHFRIEGRNIAVMP